MKVGKSVENHYTIFKLRQDEHNVEYAAEGPAGFADDIHGPLRTRIESRKVKGLESCMQHFTDHIMDRHMKYLKEEGASPRHSNASYLSFSYELPYEEAMSGSRWRFTESLSNEEKSEFRQCMNISHERDVSDL